MKLTVPVLGQAISPTTRFGRVWTAAGRSRATVVRTAGNPQEGIVTLALMSLPWPLTEPPKSLKML